MCASVTYGCTDCQISTYCNRYSNKAPIKISYDFYSNCIEYTDWIQYIIWNKVLHDCAKYFIVFIEKFLIIQRNWYDKVGGVKDYTCKISITGFVFGFFSDEYKYYK